MMKRRMWTSTVKIVNIIPYGLSLEENLGFLAETNIHVIIPL